MNVTAQGANEHVRPSTIPADPPRAASATADSDAADAADADATAADAGAAKHPASGNDAGS